MNTRVFVVVLASQILLAHQTFADAASESADFQALVVEGRQTLDDTLIDYPSARFRHVFPLIWHESGGLMNPHPKTYPAFCGEMNARNRMGGYGGWEPFFLAPQADSYRRLVSGNLAYQWCSTVSPSVAAENANIDWSAKLAYAPQTENQWETPGSGSQMHRPVTSSPTLDPNRSQSTDAAETAKAKPQCGMVPIDGGVRLVPCPR